MAREENDPILFGDGGSSGGGDGEGVSAGIRMGHLVEFQFNSVGSLGRTRQEPTLLLKNEIHLPALVVPRVPVLGAVGFVP